MFDLFTSTKPHKTHARSQSSPYSSTHPKPSFLPNNYSTRDDNDHPFSHQHTVPQPPALSHPPPYILPSASQLPPLLTPAFPNTRPTRSTSKLSDWFTGESEPFTFTILPSPAKEKLDPVVDMSSSLPERTVAAQPKQPPPPKPPIISRVSHLSSKQTPSKNLQTPADIHD
ncbi:MAG: hypothetical protein Q9198_003992 [Flavoplaca austrocitrina]